ncbi:MAG: transposase, partial [Thermoguttaceae bacterium]
GFYLLPGLVRTYAPEARTPVLHEKQTRVHLSVMGGMTLEGKVYAFARQQSLNETHTIEFLLYLPRIAGSRLLVIWDGSPIHRRQEVREFVDDTRGRVRVEPLSSYAPDLNLWDEGGWHHLKYVEMRNLVCRDLEEWHENFHFAVGRFRHKPHLTKSFFAQAGLAIDYSGLGCQSDGIGCLRWSLVLEMGARLWSAVSAANGAKKRAPISLAR